MGANPVNSNNPNGKRLMSPNDQTNAICEICHKPTGIANAAPKWFTTISTFEKSAHGNNSRLNPLTGQPTLCTDCHDVHGSAGAYPAMTKKSNQNLCYDCHTGGKVRNDAISGFSLASSIKEAFSLSGGKHPLGTGFVVNGKSYTLQCTSCHNVHVMTGKYWEADQDKTPVTRFFNNTSPWGGVNGQKMKDYAAAAGGKYQKPFVSANTYDGNKLPDYASFCLDCHASAINSIVAKDWVNNPHGKKTAGLSGMISGGGVDGVNYGGPKDCPDWKGCGRAIDWTKDRPSPSGTQDNSWPVIPKGRGTNAFVLGAYNQAERNAGGNYVLACTDCHEAHGSVNYKNLRKAINRDYDEADIPLANDRIVLDDSPTDGTLGLCMQCHNPKNTREHSFNPGWHNNGTCASGPCHQPDPYNHTSFGNDICYGRCHSSTYVWNTDLKSDPNQWSTFHENRRLGNNNQTAADQSGLVFHYAFENNLKDSNSWNLHGYSFNGAVSYAAGKVGNAVVLNDRPVEVGTEEVQWGSTTYNSGGAYGNTSKLTEMKYNTTVEAWVYPTSNPSDGYERKIVAKHTYWDGGYALVLLPKSGQYRVGFTTNMGYGGPTTSWDWDTYNANGLRGSYSSVEIPLNKWTHIAASFDYQGPYADPNNQSVGKIRIYVNGEDKTASDKTNSAYVEPQNPADAGTYDEEFMTPYPIMQEKYPSRDSGWMTSALSVGGLNWSATNDNFVGMLDEVKLWYITQPVSYFTAIDASIAPTILSAVVSGINKITVTFSEGVYANPDATGSLAASDFAYTDVDNGRTVAAVTHSAGSSTAILTLSSNLDDTNDIGVDTVAAASNQIFDDGGAVMGTEAVVLTGSLCPNTADFEMNWAAQPLGATVTDESGLLTGVVNRPDLRIKSVVGSAGSNSLAVTFSKGVYTNTGSSGALTAADFQFIDGDNSRTVTGVTHTAGAATATVTLSSALDATSDIGVDRLGAASGSAIYDNTSTGMASTLMTVTSSAPGLTTAIPGDGYFYGDGMASMNFIKFEGQNTCLQATANLTLEARIKPQGIPNDSVSYYVTRIFGKRADAPPNGACTNCEVYQMSLWRQPKDCLYDGYNKAPCTILPSQWSPNYIPQPGVASIALMVVPSDWAHGDTTNSSKWKPVLTEATNSASPEYCPIVNDHWYYVKVVWNAATGGASGHPAADIYVEDQGTDGAGAGQNWAGLKNCTDADQSQFPVPTYTTSNTNKRLYVGDSISTGSGRFTAGGSDTDFSYTEFNGLIDWIKVTP